MPAMTTPTRTRLAIVGIALLAPLLVSVNATIALEPVEDTPPVVTDVAVSPSSLPAMGGQVTISLYAVDDFGVTMVTAEVYLDNSLITSVNLPLSGGRFSGTADIPPNHDEAYAYYSVIYYAYDINTYTFGYAGEVRVDGTPPFDERPVAWDPSVSPTSLPSTGGAVALAVSAWDLRGISSAEAVVTGPIGPTPVPLEGISADRFAGTFMAPSNTTTNALTYTVVMTVYDDIGQWMSIDGASFTVAGTPAPARDAVTISPDQRSFGKVVVGQTGRATVVLRRSNTKLTQPLTGFVTSSGPFTIVGAGPDGLPFSLLPGKQLTITIEFRPTILGPQIGVLRVLRADGAQPTLTATLTGQGTAQKK
jgi:hypothetical protein